MLPKILSHFCSLFVFIISLLSSAFFTNWGLSTDLRINQQGLQLWDVPWLEAHGGRPGVLVHPTPLPPS